LEAELFGYKKGAFSGATEDRPGLVRAAHAGTLFLDEVAELSAAAQAALLRVIQEREVTPVGGVRPVLVDFRLVCATHRDLKARVDEGLFRADLFARIAGFVLRLPSLRERREDLGLIIAALLRRLAPDRTDRIAFSVPAARRLMTYPWPLNVRQLEQCLSAALALTDGRIEQEHLRLADESSSPQPLQRALKPHEESRREQLIGLLQKHHGNITAVAREMERDRVQIRRWIKQYQLRVEDYG
jgi:DNA-binding NtrC family response regulator